jgi:L-alanine-DL-glutamate epimerase-like enolase superfamily enzyme
MSPPRLNVTTERWPTRGSFVIARGAVTAVETVVAAISADGHVGRGECRPYPRYGETPAGVAAAIAALAEEIAAGLDRETLQRTMPAGAARNALDAALLDLEAKRSGRRAWEILGLAAPKPLVTAFTLSLDTPERMRAAARAAADRPLLKVKLGAAGDEERIAAVREGAPAARLIVDANEGWSAKTLAENLRACAACGVVLVEQPLPADDDAALGRVDRPVPVCADESVHDRHGLAALVGRYDAVNIKLDKAGGLTEALLTIAEARRRGLGVMVGCMVASSLAMAPAVLAAQGAEIVDLDGPLLLARDRPHGLRYEGSTVFPPEPGLWG